MTKDLADELERLAKEATTGSLANAARLSAEAELFGTLYDRLPEILSALRGEQWQGTETMPANTRVLVWVDEKHMHGVQFGSAHRNSDGTLVAKPAGCNGGPWAITHWRPLPPPPKGTTHE